MKKHNISIDNMGILPYPQRMERMCREKNAFLTYKVNRVDILKDKEAK
jgi:hypothetical protein